MPLRETKQSQKLLAECFVPRNDLTFDISIIPKFDKVKYECFLLYQHNQLHN
jgi:hypothetical protein